MRKYVAEVFAVIEGELPGLRRVTKFVPPACTVKITRQRKLDRRDRYSTYILTVGAPNYEERTFIARCRKAKEPFPIKKVQLRFYPKKK